MRTMKYFSLLVLLSTIVFMSGCDIEEYGCTDPNATNFNYDAEIDDGSCFYGMDPGYGQCSPHTQGNLVISNHTGEQLYLYSDYTEDSYGGDAYVTCIPPDTMDFLVNIPNEDLSVCLLQIWKASDVSNTSHPDLSRVHRQWSVALSNSTESAERANWLITGLDDVTGTGTLLITYPERDEYDHDVIYQVDILLNSQSGAKLASLQPGIEAKKVSVDYGVHYLYFHYWYSDPNSSSGTVTDIGWHEISEIVINDSHREAEIDIPVFNSIIGKYGEVTVVNSNDHVVNVYANGGLIEDIAIVDGSTQGLSSIPSGSQTSFLVPVEKYTITTHDLGGKVDDEFTNVLIVQEENVVLQSGVENKTISIINSTDEILGLFNLQEQYLGLTIEVGKQSPDYVIPASCDTLLVMDFARTRIRGFGYDPTVTVVSLLDYMNNRIEMLDTWPIFEGAYESPVIDHDDATLMNASLINSEVVTLSFEYNVSSEAGYDLFRFEIDGFMEISGVGGDSGWVSFTKTVGPGTHSLEWIYAKDQTRSEGRDNVQIRNIVID